MADAFTTRVRAEKPEVNANDGTWGDELNDNTFDMFDEAIAGVVSKAVAGANITLSANNGTADESRNPILILTGTPGATRQISYPDVEGHHIVINSTDATQTIKAGAGTSVSLPLSHAALIYTDGATNAVAAWIAPLSATLVGTAAVQTLTNKTLTSPTINGGTFSGGTDITVADGGTGASDAATARTNLGVAFSGAMVKKSADENTANYTAATAMTFNTEIYDVGGWHDNAVNNTRLTVPAGVTYVRVGANVALSATTADTWKTLQLFKNGSASFDGACGIEQESGDTGMLLSFASGVIPCVATDFFEVKLREESDASITVTAAQTNFWIEAVPA